MSDVDKYFKFKAEYSWVFVPLLLILYFFSPVYIAPLLSSVSIVGSIELIFYDRFNPLWQWVATLIIHAALIIPVIISIKLELLNVINIITFLVSLIFVLFTPHWPYLMSRAIMAIIVTIAFYLLMLSSYLLRMGG